MSTWYSCSSITFAFQVSRTFEPGSVFASEVDPVDVFTSDVAKMLPGIKFPPNS